jgi:uncharacterized protein (DUF305 family)
MAALVARGADLAGVAATASGSAPVRALAVEIHQDQSRQATQLAGWLTAWGHPKPQSGGPSPGAAVPGSVSSHEVRALGRLSTIGFDRPWLTLMTQQQRVEARLAEIESRTGRSTEAKALAHAVLATSRIELARMHSLLGDQGD